MISGSLRKPSRTSLHGTTNAMNGRATMMRCTNADRLDPLNASTSPQTLSSVMPRTIASTRNVSASLRRTQNSARPARNACMTGLSVSPGFASTR
jgi:hypothetical protein